MKKTTYHLTIDIVGKSAEELFAVGQQDLLEYFLPEKMFVDKDDVMSLGFLVTEIEDNTHRSHQHPDNYQRPSAKERIEKQQGRLWNENE